MVPIFLLIHKFMVMVEYTFDLEIFNLKFQAINFFWFCCCILSKSKGSPIFTSFFALINIIDFWKMAITSQRSPVGCGLDVDINYYDNFTPMVKVLKCIWSHTDNNNLIILMKVLITSVLTNLIIITTTVFSKQILC